MQTATVTNGKTTGFNLSHLSAKAAEGKVFAEELVETGKRKAEKMIRAGEDYLDDTKHYIKHHPWQSIGVALGAGLTLGFLSGFLSRRH